VRKQWRQFVNEYLKDFNATQAAMRAGYSEKTAYSQGSRLLKNVEIADAIKKRLDDAAMESNEVLMRLAEQARGLYSLYFIVEKMVDLDEDGDEITIVNRLGVNYEQLIADGMGHLVKSVSYNKDGGLTKIEFYDAQAALVQIGRHHKLFTDKHEVYIEPEEEDREDIQRRLSRLAAARRADDVPGQPDAEATKGPAA
jgi:phage terminase small subunit